MQEVFFIDRWIQEGMDKGLWQGVQQGEFNLILRRLKKRFGELNVGFENRIQALPSEKLEKLSEDLLDFASKKDLTEWLKENS